MSIHHQFHNRISLPAVCAPMFQVSNPPMVKEACKSGIIGALPIQNAQSYEEFEGWLKEIRTDLDRFSDTNPTALIGPLAVNIPAQLPPKIIERYLEGCLEHGVEIIISAVGNPMGLARQTHEAGLKIFHDVTTFRFAEKAIAAGVDGLTCIGAGGGGHSGLISHLSLIPRIRAIFDGTILMAGSISTGAGIRAAELLGADLAYIGTRFIATKEAAVNKDYARMLVECHSEDLMFTAKVGGVAANWLVQSMEQVGLDPQNLPEPTGRGMSYDHLPSNVRPWKNLWSAGQGIDLIKDVPAMAVLISRLRKEYIAACEQDSFAEAARLAEEAHS